MTHFLRLHISLYSVLRASRIQHCLSLFQAHYFIFHVKIARAHKRKFDSKGKEIEPNFSETKKVNTGYLNSSYSKLAVAYL